MKKILCVLLLFPLIASARSPNHSVRAIFPRPCVSESVSCACEGNYSVGDRVQLLTANPDGATNLPAGKIGTVVSGITYVRSWLFISWDNWQEGHPGNGHAMCPATMLGDASGWYAECGDVGKVD